MTETKTAPKRRTRAKATAAKRPPKKPEYERVKEAIQARMTDAVECIFNDDDKTVHFKTQKIIRAKDPQKRRRVPFENSLNLSGVKVGDVDYLIERTRIFG